MGAKDIVTKDYLKDRYVFADAFNQFMYGGEQVVVPERLHSLDSTAIGIPYGSDDKGVSMQRYRDGPMCLHDMFSVKDQRVLDLAADYKINLLSPANMTEEEINQFKTDLREVMLFIKYSKDKKKLMDVVEKDERFRRMDKKAVKVIRTVTGANFEVGGEMEEVDMCQAIEEMKEAVRNAVIFKLIDSGKGAPEVVASVLQLSDEEVEEIAREGKSGLTDEL